jgi:leader peptidase (prepilin peptidase)/N-methyltransferase
VLAGLAIALLLRRYGLIQDSFVDAHERVVLERDESKPGSSDRGGRIKAVAFTKTDTVNPRREMLRELVLLGPAIILGIAAAMAVRHIPAVGGPWADLLRRHAGPGAGPHVNGLLGAVWGFVIGGGIVWAVRILGTLAFGKEAMGRGDVHLMAAVGAVTGWAVPVLAFFVAPFFGLLWALHLWLRKGQRELPYGPWLAMATAAVMIFYDALIEFLGFYTRWAGGAR